MTARRALPLLAILAIAGGAAAQVAPWSVEMRTIARREELCTMERDRPLGPCLEVARLTAGAWTAAVVRPRDPGRYLGDRTMKWHLVLESGARRFATTRPIQHEATICTGEGHERIGGHESLVVESLEARDLAGATTPEIVLRWREWPGSPVGVHVCSVEGRRPRCSGPHADGAIARDPGGVRIGTTLIPLP